MSKTDLDAFFLVGPTAVGKTGVAHCLARAEASEILSADAMLIYRGMDIGTAKPATAEREEVTYRGLDLATPDETYSAGRYCDYAGEVLRNARSKGKKVIVVGGTGLYVKCLTEGLEELPADDGALRREAEALLEREGLAGLQDVVMRADPKAYSRLADKENPRRLVRALELARGGASPQRGWAGPPSIPVVGLEMDRALLGERIERRVETMYERGLLDEVRALVETYGTLSKTAAQAIGYKEALAVVRGAMPVEEAMASTVRRTKQLAKRQMTWFRHQANVQWVEVRGDMDVQSTAAQVRAHWEKHGPTPVAI